MLMSFSLLYSADGGEAYLGEGDIWKYKLSEEKINYFYNGIQFGSDYSYLLDKLRERMIKIDSSYIIIANQIDSFPVETSYLLNSEGEFYMVSHFFKQFHYSSKYFISDYNKLKKLIAEKYGSPQKDENYYSNSFLIGNEEYAMDRGLLKKITVWIIDDITIDMSLEKVQTSYILKINYTCNLFKY